ncbi:MULTISPECIES: PTS sugar transporter subunit IIA [unclassified Romboutsia]|uniref:PTS sugar transporter subunit IIA n=1 Tax=unclassified Romboutsia TaxID=2626894 RepID=UPI000822DEDA|nr:MULTISPECIES: PTS mannose transporter subunit IID [unclassified Romboutsia]SCH84835.1 PTS system mannose-specific transporter subunits IIAB [uncultured Clostridium sp.]
MKILIVGHGEYATGMKSSIKLLTGVSNNIEAINLNEELTHNEYTMMVQEYVANNKDLIIFADMTGGAPFQIASREILLNEESENQFVIGGVSVGCILEVVMNTLVLNSEDKLENIINTAVNNIQEMTSIISRKDLVTQEI